MKEILIWGKGEIESEFESYLDSSVKIVGYIDSFHNNYALNDISVYSPSAVFKEKQLQYDYVVVASVYTNDIYNTILEFNGDLKKIIFLRPFQVDSIVDQKLRNLKLLSKIAPAYMDIAERENGYKMGIDGKQKTFTDNYPLYQWDYFRYRTFELCADQIVDLKGDVAEAGVFKGFFSKLINAKFPNDIFYLFDTFEGFSDDEAQREKKAGHCDEAFIEMFKNTSVESVLQKMPNKEKCIVKKGFFPQSAEKIDANFKFVSIDFDFEESIYNALDWFYPKMVNGGYIFIHDYNEPTLVGVKKAVERYENKYGELIKIPIADKCGSLIIRKYEI